MTKYGFKYCSNSSFRIVPATDLAGYSLLELKEILKKHYSTELELLETMDDGEFLDYYSVKMEK